jgi:hypothetical protein
MLTTPYEAFCGSAASKGNKKTNKQQTQPCLAAVVWVCCSQYSIKLHETFTELFFYCADPVRVIKFKKDPILVTTLGHERARAMR